MQSNIMNTNRSEEWWELKYFKVGLVGLVTNCKVERTSSHKYHCEPLHILFPVALELQGIYLNFACGYVEIILTNNFFPSLTHLFYHCFIYHLPPTLLFLFQHPPTFLHRPVFFIFSSIWFKTDPLAWLLLVAWL